MKDYQYAGLRSLARAYTFHVGVLMPSGIEITFKLSTGDLVIGNAHRIDEKSL